MFGSGSADLAVQLSKFKNSRWRLTAILDIQKNGYKFATSSPIDVMFGSVVGFSVMADLMVELSNVKNPIWRQAAILSTNMRLTRKR